MGVVIKGLRELERDLHRAGNQFARKDLYAALKRGGDVVRDEARARAKSQFQQQTGDLVRLIKTRRRRATVSVTAEARHRGYLYPGRLEFGGRGTSQRGPRAFLGPALEAKRDEAVRLIRDGLDATFRKHNL